MLAALLRPLFNADSGEAARELVGDALERLRKPLPKVAALLEEAEEDLLAFYAFPADHWPKLRSTNPLERVNREIGRRTDVVGIFPNDRSLIRLAASVVIEQNDEWLVGRRYLSNHSLEAVLDQEKRRQQTERRRASSPRPEQPTIMPTSYTTSWDLTRCDSLSGLARRSTHAIAVRTLTHPREQAGVRHRHGRLRLVRSERHANRSCLQSPSELSVSAPRGRVPRRGARRCGERGRIAAWVIEYVKRGTTRDTRRTQFQLNASSDRQCRMPRRRRTFDAMSSACNVKAEPDPGRDSTNLFGTSKQAAAEG